MKKKPLTITLKYYNKEISTRSKRSDLAIDELHELWIDIVKSMGYHHKVITDFYKK
jgi:hypothetical protein